MSEVLQFVNNTIQVFAYEGFDYTISNPFTSLTLQNVSNTGGLNPSSLYFTKTDDLRYRFSVEGVSNNLTPGTSESFTLRVNDASGVVLTSSNIVSIGAGRLLDSNRVSLSNTSYTFFKGDPITQTLRRPLRILSPSFQLNTPTSVPALPPGLSFVRVNGTTFDIQGTPRVAVASNNYQIIGVQTSGSKIATTRISITVNRERLQLDLSGQSIINGMQIGTAIGPRVLTAVVPVGQTTIQYTFPTLPDGIVARNILGSNVSSPFFPTDPSFTMIVAGTPTLAAATAFANAKIDASGTEIKIRANAGALENTQGLTFAFGETILFDRPVISDNYVGVSVDPSVNFFRAQTYFTGLVPVPITNISAARLPAGLSISFNPTTFRGSLSGIPSVASSEDYIIRASNANGRIAETSSRITIVNDSVSFSSPVDLCYNFILSRPATQSKLGYYPSNIQFIARAASGRSVSLSAPALVGTGLSLDSNGLLTGIPSTITPLTDLNVTASVAGSPATAVKQVKFAILNDAFEFSDVCATSLSFIQNVDVTPFRFSASTLSDRNIVDYSQIGFPDGLTINPDGVVSGRPLTSSPTSGNVQITATTGYTSGSENFAYTLVPDSMIFIVDPRLYTYQAAQPISSINVNAFAYSGVTVSNYDLSMTQRLGMTINPSNGIISGTWTDSAPPNQIIPAQSNFFVTGEVGRFRGGMPSQIDANPIVSNVMLVGAYGDNSETEIPNSFLYHTSSSNITTFVSVSNANNLVQTPLISDIQFKNNNVTDNVVLISSDSNILRGTNLGNFSNVVGFSINNKVSSFASINGTSNWRAGGRLKTPEFGIDVGDALLFASSDDGLTWGSPLNVLVGGIAIRSRDDGLNVPTNPYLNAGLALKYKQGVLMVGGAVFSNVIEDPFTMARSTNAGSTWSSVVGGFESECAYFNFDNENMWIATGSGRYRGIDYAPPTGSPQSFTENTSTIKYSTNQGSNWSNATGDFNMFGYEIAYGNGTWLATGVTCVPVGPLRRYVPEVRFSTNGSNWTKVDLSSNDLFSPTNTSPLVAPLRIGSLAFDGDHWNVFVNEELPIDGGIRMYRHDTSSSLQNGWVSVDISSSFTPTLPDANPNLRLLSFSAPKYLYTNNPPINIGLTLNIEPVGVLPPTFTSPTITSFLQYQYIPIVPIQLSATGGGFIYFFVESDSLPPGLVFDRLTSQITGTSVLAGNHTTTIYAKNSGGAIQSLSLLFTTIVPRIIQKQEGAGAYTSLLRQYTEVLGAQNSRDNRALPTQERALGTFMSPEAPDSITQVIDPKCRKSGC